MYVPVRMARMHTDGLWCVSEPSKGRGATRRISSISISTSSSIARVCVSVCEQACVCEGLVGRGEADTAGLPGEEEGVVEQTQPLSSTAGEPGAKDTTGSVDQPGAAGTVDTRRVSVSLYGGGLLLKS